MTDSRTWTAFDDAGQPVPVVMPEVYDHEDTALMTTPLQAAALRYACHLEPGPMAEVATSLGVSQQAISDMVARIRERLGFRRERKQRGSKA